MKFCGRKKRKVFPTQTVTLFDIRQTVMFIGVEPKFYYINFLSVDNIKVKLHSWREVAVIVILH